MEKRFGKYEIVSRLGAGAQGEVFLAKGPNGEKVALKLLHTQFGRDKDVAGRFRRESRIAMSVVHPNVVRALDAGEENGRLYMACEFVEGGGLDSLISREGKLGEARALELFMGLLSGLDAIHKAGMIHRDVKPANILLDSKGVARLTDLGLARSTSADRTKYTATGMLVGSPAYMAPEQVEPTGELDIRCDLYSAGIVLFQCLSGQLPFKGATILDTLRAQIETPAPRLHSVEPSVRPEISKLVFDLMQKNPSDRPSTPAEVLARVGAIAKPAAAAGAVAAGAAKFDSTLDSDAGFPGTIDAAECAQPAGPGPAFPMTLDVPEGDAFPVTMGVIEGASKAAAPAQARPEKIELLPAQGSGISGLARAKLVFEGPQSQKILFLYAGSRLQMGRDGLDRCDSEVCLRLQPAQGNEDAIRRISGKHLRIEIQGANAVVRDLKSTCGTLINGKPVAPDSPTAITGSCRMRVAGVIDLDVLVLPQEATPALSLKGIGSAHGSSPSVFVSRPGNGSDHAYALVPCRFALSAGPVGKWLGPAAGGIEVFCVNGGLWAMGGPIGDGAAVALAQGAIFGAGAASVMVSEISPADQK